MQRYEAHRDGCRPEVCSGCAVYIPDDLGDVVMFTDHQQQLERMRAEFREALAARDAEIARLYSERKPQ